MSRATTPNFNKTIFFFHWIDEIIIWKNLLNKQMLFPDKITESKKTGLNGSNGDGTYMQYRGKGKPHGPIERPNIKENHLNSLPDGTCQPGKPTYRYPDPKKIPN